LPLLGLDHGVYVFTSHLLVTQHSQPDWPGSVSYCITAMPEYAHLSFEELRYAHYKPGEQGRMPRRGFSSLLFCPALTLFTDD
jgi:hypothetical protein